MIKLISAAAIAFLLTACTNAPIPSSSLSDTCIIKGDGTPAKVTGTYQGTEVGFCCNDCKSKFEGMSGDDQAKLIDTKSAKTPTTMPTSTKKPDQTGESADAGKTPVVGKTAAPATSIDASLCIFTGEAAKTNGPC